MAIKHFCDRCDRELRQRTASVVTVLDNLPLLGDEYDPSADAPRASSRQTVLCEACVQSFSRWLEHAERVS